MIIEKEKDRKGTTSSVFRTLGASSHCDHEREPMDFYATDPSAVCYAWYVWEKGYKGDTIVRWID